MAYKVGTETRNRPTALPSAVRRQTRKREPDFISKKEGAALLDRQARKYLKISGKEFRDRYKSGDLNGLDAEAVRRVSFILPMSNE